MRPATTAQRPGLLTPSLPGKRSTRHCRPRPGEAAPPAQCIKPTRQSTRAQLRRDTATQPPADGRTPAPVRQTYPASPEAQQCGPWAPAPPAPPSPAGLTRNSPGKARAVENNFHWPLQAPLDTRNQPGVESMGDCKSTNLGRDRLRSVDRNNKTTLLLTRRCGTNKSYAKDLSPRMVKLQDVS